MVNPLAVFLWCEEEAISNGTSGAYATNYGGNNTGAAYSMLLQGDGKIVIGGQAQDSGWAYGRFGVARVTTSGATDTTFASNGALTTDLGSAAYLTAILQTDTDKILVGGQDNSGSNWELAQYTAVNQ